MLFDLNGMCVSALHISLCFPKRKLESAIVLFCFFFFLILRCILCLLNSILLCRCGKSVGQRAVGVGQGTTVLVYIIHSKRIIEMNIFIRSSMNILCIYDIKLMYTAMKREDFHYKICNKLRGNLYNKLNALALNLNWSKSLFLVEEYEH